MSNTIAPIAISANNIEIYSRANGDKHYHRPDLHVEVLKKITLPTDGGFKFAVIDMGHVIGVDHLVKTTQEDKIVYIKRGNRTGFSRMVMNREAEETRFVTAILCKNTDPADPDFLPGTEGKWVLVTLFEGDPGEKEPFDRAFAKASEDPAVAKSLAKSWKFWATHALIPTPEELAEIRKGYYSHLQFIEKNWKETNEFADQDKANNGGGYSQPSIELQFIDGVKCFIDDFSCGDFGTRISACFQIGSDKWIANYGSMENRYESEIPEELFSKHIKLIENRYGYHIPTKEQCAQWNAEEEAELEDFDWE